MQAGALDSAQRSSQSYTSIGVPSPTTAAVPPPTTTNLDDIPEEEHTSLAAAAAMTGATCNC